MKFYINKNNEIFAYSSEQEMQQFAKEPLTEITQAELAELQAPTQAELDAQKVSEAKAYLSSTDFYMTVDKYATLTEERQVELTQLRAEARELINALEINND